MEACGIQNVFVGWTQPLLFDTCIVYFQHISAPKPSPPPICFVFCTFDWNNENNPFHSGLSNPPPPPLPSTHTLNTDLTVYEMSKRVPFQRGRAGFARPNQIDHSGTISVEPDSALQEAYLVRGIFHAPMDTAIDASGEIMDLAALAAHFVVSAESVFFVTKQGAQMASAPFKKGASYLISGDLVDGQDGDVEAAVNKLLESANGKIYFAYDPIVLGHVPDNDRVLEAPPRVERSIEAILSHPLLKQLMPEAPAPLPRQLPCNGNTEDNLAPNSIPTTEGKNGLIQWIHPRYALQREIYRVHPQNLYQEFLSGVSTLADNVPFTTTDLYCDDKGNSTKAVLATCGMVIDASAAVIASLNQPDAPSSSAFCLVRPPGHHCSHEKPSGFCLVNNVVVAAESLRSRAGLGSIRIAIVDCDVHHGDGTQALIEGNENYFYFSTHRCDKNAFFPFGTGRSENVGEMRNCLNIPFDTDAVNPQECHKIMSDLSYTRAVDELLVEKLVAFRPDVVYISCGFDALHGDQLGRMGLSVNGYRNVVVAIRKALATLRRTESGDFRKNRGIVLVLEGGYNPTAVSKGVVAMFSALLFGKAGSQLCALAAGTDAPYDDNTDPAYFKCKVPPNWDELRCKQQALIHRLNVSKEMEGADETAPEPAEDGIPLKAHPPTPIPVALSNAELYANHAKWVEETLETAKAAASRLRW